MQTSNDHPSESAKVDYLCSGLEQHLERFKAVRLQWAALADSCDLMLAIVRRGEAARGPSSSQAPMLSETGRLR